MTKRRINFLSPPCLRFNIIKISVFFGFRVILYVYLLSDTNSIQKMLTRSSLRKRDMGDIRYPYREPLPQLSLSSSSSSSDDEEEVYKTIRTPMTRNENSEDDEEEEQEEEAEYQDENGRGEEEGRDEQEGEEQEGEGEEEEEEEDEEEEEEEKVTDTEIETKEARRYAREEVSRDGSTTRDSVTMLTEELFSKKSGNFQPKIPSAIHGVYPLASNVSTSPSPSSTLATTSSLTLSSSISSPLSSSTSSTSSTLSSSTSSSSSSTSSPSSSSPSSLSSRPPMLARSDDRPQQVPVRQKMACDDNSCVRTRIYQGDDDNRNTKVEVKERLVPVPEEQADALVVIPSTDYSPTFVIPSLESSAKLIVCKSKDLNGLDMQIRIKRWLSTFRDKKLAPVIPDEIDEQVFQWFLNTYCGIDGLQTNARC